MATDDSELSERLQRLFLDELDEHVERLEAGWDTLAVALPEVPAETVDELFRSAHSLKGAAQSVGSSMVAALCHHLEDSLVRVRDGSLRVDEKLLAGMASLTDSVGELAVALRQGERQPVVDIDSIVAGLVAAPVAAPHVASGSAPVSSLRPAARPAPPVRPVGGADGGSVRVARHKLDALLAQAGDLIASSLRGELLVTQLAAECDRLGVEAAQWSRDREVISRALGTTAQDEERARQGLDRVDVRTREASSELVRLTRSAANQQRALRTLATTFAEAARQARTVAFTDATAGLSRLVRDLASGMGKEVVLVVDAVDVEVDKELVATLHDALGHAVRNAVDHGLESPGERAASGKPRMGTIEITAALRNNGIEIRVSDDGRGVDLDSVRTAAAELGLAQRDITEVNVAEVLFQPGLSTAVHVSDVSGRGVGLDAVRAAVEAHGGTVTLVSEPGVGTRLELLVPLTVSTFRAVLVRSAGEVVALPVAPIRTLTRVPSPRTVLDGREIIQLDGEALPVARLSRLLGWSESDPDEDPRHGSMGLLVGGLEGAVVLLVEEIVSEREIVLRTPPARLAGMSLLLGTTQLEDGSVALVLNPAACVRAELSGPRERTATPTEEPVDPRRVLLVEDTLTTRELERSILESAGYSVVVAVDGRQAWHTLQTSSFDVVVSDVNMPHMDGFALCRSIRSSRTLAALPVILVTSLHSPADRQRGLDAGADAYLTKTGFDRGELLSTLESLL